MHLTSRAALWRFFRILPWSMIPSWLSSRSVSARFVRKNQASRSGFKQKHIFVVELLWRHQTFKLLYWANHALKKKVQWLIIHIGCFLKWWYPPISTPKMIIFSRKTQWLLGKPHHFRKSPISFAQRWMFWGNRSQLPTFPCRKAGLVQVRQDLFLELGWQGALFSIQGVTEPFLGERTLEVSGWLVRVLRSVFSLMKILNKVIKEHLKKSLGFMPTTLRKSRLKHMGVSKK